jgi:hypothetical protein
MVLCPKERRGLGDGWLGRWGPGESPGGEGGRAGHQHMMYENVKSEKKPEKRREHRRQEILRAK